MNQNYNGNEFWDSEINTNPANLRNRQNRAVENPFLFREPFSTFWQKTAMLRERIKIELKEWEIIVNKQKELKLSSNPFEIFR